MSHKIIRSLFELRLAAWAAERELRVSYQGVNFTPASDETYLSAFMLPAGTNTNTLSGDHRVYTGVFQINVVTPVGNGTGDAEGLVDELADLFPAFLRLKRDEFEVLVLTPVEPGPPIIGDTTLTVSASFQYRSDTN
ncbi:phage tail terminator-like protein [Pseudomonas viridiflava]|uniref:phage tail terminator-like protein n=1 Tax=Pseudomonas viridiflava TaxID=33069 RepID=UPI000F06FF56|nr:phage tail terminator-like protein [Pseudomonas viridiflava]